MKFRDGKEFGLVNTFKCRKIKIACLNEVKYVGEKATFFSHEYKLFYMGKMTIRNGIGIVVEQDILHNVVGVSRISNRLMVIKLIFVDKIIHILTAYAPKIGLLEADKTLFWKNLEHLIQQIPMEENILLWRDFNGHIGMNNVGYEAVHEGYSFGQRNETGHQSLNLLWCIIYASQKPIFKKKEEYLITFKSGVNKSQIDFFMLKKNDCFFCKQGHL